MNYLFTIYIYGIQDLKNIFNKLTKFNRKKTLSCMILILWYRHDKYGKNNKTHLIIVLTFILILMHLNFIKSKLNQS